MSDFSFISNAHPAYIESMYVRFLENPTSIEPEWYHFFKGFEFAESSTIEKRSPGTNFSTKEFQVVALINAYRSRGHLLSTTNPINETSGVVYYIVHFFLKLSTIKMYL